VVRRNHPVALPALSADVDEVSGFLVSHVEELLKGADSHAAPITSVLDQARKARFEELRTGTNAEFLAAAHSLTTDLVSQMGRVNSKEGVLVCASFEDADGDTIAAAIKLQVVSDHGAVLEKLASGDTVLSAVERVLDRPGELQKGLVYPDPRPASQAVIGDKANQSEARYFLLAMGVEAEEHPKKALGEVASALVEASPTASRDNVIRNLGASDSGGLADVVAAATEGISLTRPVTDIVRDLSERERPIRAVDTKTLLKCTIQADAIKMRLPASDLERVTIEPSLEGGWIINVRVDSEPTVSLHS
jgi:hypothetical protein